MYGLGTVFPRFPHLFGEFQFELWTFSQEVKTESMVRGGAMLAYGLTVCLGGVTLVLVPVVGGVFLVNLLHEVITVGLGKDAGSGYAEELTVPLHYGGVGEGLAARAEGEWTF